jgi:ureidoglycolate hydrolase
MAKIVDFRRNIWKGKLTKIGKKSGFKIRVLMEIDKIRTQ